MEKILFTIMFTIFASARAWAGDKTETLKFALQQGLQGLTPQS